MLPILKTVLLCGEWQSKHLLSHFSKYFSSVYYTLNSFHSNLLSNGINHNIPFFRFVIKYLVHTTESSYVEQTMSYETHWPRHALLFWETHQPPASIKHEQMYHKNSAKIDTKSFFFILKVMVSSRRSLCMLTQSTEVGKGMRSGGVNIGN